jgi:hypothetical protein
LDREQFAGRQPSYFVEKAKPFENAVLHLARVARVCSLVQRGFNGQPARAVDGRRAAKARIALEKANGMASLCEKRTCG